MKSHCMFIWFIVNLFILICLYNPYDCLKQYVDLMDQCCVVLKEILEREARGWHLKYKDRLLADLKGNFLQLTSSWFILFIDAS